VPGTLLPADPRNVVPGGSSGVKLPLASLVNNCTVQSVPIELLIPETGSVQSTNLASIFGGTQLLNTHCPWPKAARETNTLGVMRSRTAFMSGIIEVAPMLVRARPLSCLGHSRILIIGTQGTGKAWVRSFCQDHGVPAGTDRGFGERGIGRGQSECNGRNSTHFACTCRSER
jgi:hypothetical protein